MEYSGMRLKIQCVLYQKQMTGLGCRTGYINGAA